MRVDVEKKKAMTSLALTLLDVEAAIAPCPPTVSANAPLNAAIALMGDQHDCILVVADQAAGGALVGIVTVQDVVRGLAAGTAALEQPVAAAMTQPAVSVQRSAIATSALLWQAFQQGAVSHLPVLNDHGQILGIVTQKSLINTVNLHNTVGLPEGTLPEETLPEGTLPEGTLPEGTLPEGTLPEETLPEAIRTRGGVDDQLEEAALRLSDPVAPHPGAWSRSEAAYRALLRAIPDLLLQARGDGTDIEVLSPGRIKEFLVAEDNANPQGYRTLPPEIVARKRHYIQQAVVTRELQIFEQQLEIAGELCYEEVRVAALGANEALVIVRDITDRKALESALRESEARLNDIVNSTAAAIARVRFFANQTWEYEFCSAANEHVFGYTAAEFIADPDLWRSRVLPADWPQISATMAATMTEQSRGTEYRFHHKDGHLIWIFSSSTSRWDAAADCWIVTTMSNNISDRKAMESALRASEAKGRAILETIPDLMFRLSATGQYLEYFANHHDLDILSGDQNPTGRFMAEILPPELAQRQMTYIQRALATRQLLVYEQTVQIGDRLQHEEVRVAPSGEQEVLFIIRDIGERKRAELTLRQQAKRDRLLAHLTQQIRQSLELDQILHTTVTAVRQLLGADRVLIYRFNADWGGDMIVESVGDPWIKVLGSSLRDSYFGGELVEQYRQGRISQIADLHNSGLSPCHIDLLAQFQVQANLAVPMTCDGRLWGLLCVHQCQATRVWQPEEVDLLTQLTSQLAIALQQAELYQQVQHLNADLEHQVSERTAALQASEARFRSIFEQSPLGIVITNSEGQLLKLNPQVCQITGYSEAERLGGHYLDHVHPDDRPAAAALFHQVLQGTQPQSTVENRYLTKAGAVIWLEVTRAVIRDSQGQPSALVGMVQDITARKRLELSLQCSEAKLNHVLNTVMAAICSFRVYPDGTWEYSYYSPGFEVLLGYTPEDLTAHKHLWRSRVVAADREAVIQSLYDRILQGECTVSYEYRAYHRDGRLQWIAATLTSYWNAAEQCWMVTTVDTDIGDRKRLEAERQQTQAQLQAQKDFLQQVMDSVPSGIFVKDAALRIQVSNQTMAEDLYGLPITTLLGRRSIEVDSPNIDPVQRAAFHQEDLEVIQTGKTLVKQDRFVRPNGQVHWYQTTLKPFLDAQGQPQGMIGNAVEITDRKEAELALQESETRFRHLTENVPGMIYRYRLRLEGNDLVGDCSYVSPRCQEILGITVDELIENVGTVWHLIHPEDAAGLQAAMITCLREQLPTFRAEYRIIMPNGQTKWLQDSAQATFLSTEAMLWDGLIEDISDRKAVELALHQRMEREQILGEITRRIRDSLDLSQILETAVTEVRQIFQADRALIFRLSPSGIGVVIQESVLPAYPTTAAMHFPDECFPPDCYAHYAQGLPRIVPDITQDEWTDCLQAFLQSVGVQSKLVAPIVQQDEHDQPVVWGLLILHACADLRQWQPAEAEFLQQISDQLAIAIRQSELYHQLQNTNHHLARATRLKDEFLANMSHELRTPLNAILGLSEALQSHVFGPINPKQQQFLSTIQSSGHHLLSLINDILDLAKMEAGKLDLVIHPVAIQHLCQSSLVMVEQQALQKGVTLNFTLDSDLDRIDVDELRMRQVLVNLLNNAVKFTGTGGTVSLTVSSQLPAGAPGIMPNPASPTSASPTSASPTSSLQDRAGYLYFSIHDTGIGIAPDDLVKLFQAFVQLDSGLARHYEGTGLGLVLVQRIVHLHGGQVTVESVLGQGSRFTVALPWWQRSFDSDIQELKPWQREVAQPLIPSLAANAAGPLILLAEDNPANADMVCSYLEERGYRLLLAADGEEAIALTQRHQPELILMDIQMPGMDGLAAIRHLRQDPQSATVPIIAMTALAMSDDRERCLATGASEYLAKPVSLKQLVDMIQRLLNLG
jgi:PAS domain S-box-containing protein